MVMFGRLHIEMAALKALVDLLESSDWRGALIQASLATHGTADSFLKAYHVTRVTRVACIYFSRRRTPSTAMVWNRGAIRCH